MREAFKPYLSSEKTIPSWEDLNIAVCREVLEETSVQLNPEHIEQLITVGTPYRDPRMWTISVAYLCFMSYNDHQVEKAADDAASTHWLDIAMINGQLQLIDGDKQLSQDDLAFDHWDILLTAMKRIKGRLEYHPTILSIMPNENTLPIVSFLGHLTRIISKWIPQIFCVALNIFFKKQAARWQREPKKLPLIPIKSRLLKEGLCLTIRLSHSSIKKN